MKDKNIVFMGTPDFAVPVLEMLIDNCNVIMVVTQPDKEIGRKKEIVYSAVKKVALKHNIPVFQPLKIKEDLSVLTNLNIDLIVTCAYGQIISKAILDLPKYGCINVHASLLPKYRGSAPIQWAIFNGDEKTGVTIMYMDEGMDTGDIISTRAIPIENSDNVGTLHEKLSYIGRDLLKETLPSIFNGSATRTKQPDNFTLAPMIKRKDERLNFNDSGKNIINRIRGLNPWPLANFVLQNQEIKVSQAEFVAKSIQEIGKIIIDKNNFGITCSDGIIYLKVIKPSGKKVMTIESFLNGIDKTKYENMVII